MMKRMKIQATTPPETTRRLDPYLPWLILAAVVILFPGGLVILISLGLYDVALDAFTQMIGFLIVLFFVVVTGLFLISLLA